jgi:hypothetical protein
MSRSKRPLLLAAAILGGLASLALWALFVLWNLYLPAPGVGGRLLESLQARPGVRVPAEPESLWINPLRGARVEGLQIAQDLPRASLELEVERLWLQPRLLTSLREGTLQLKAVRLLRPTITLSTAQPGAPAADPKEDRSGSKERRRSGAESGRRPSPPEPSPTIELEMRDGKLLLLGGEEREALLRLSGVSMNLEVARLAGADGPAFQRLAASGEISIERLATPLWELPQAKGALDLDAGVLSLSQLESRYPGGGRSRLDLQLDLSGRRPRYSLVLEADSIDPGPLLSAATGPGFGPADLRLEASGRDDEVQTLRGRGRLLLRPGRLGSVEALRRLEAELEGSRALVGAAYDQVEADFTLRRGRLVLDRPVMIRTEAIDLTLRGWVSLEGELRLRAALDTSREGLEVDGLQPELLDFAADDDGRIRLAFEVTGTRDDPRFSLAAEDLDKYRRRLRDPEKRQQLIEGVLKELLERAEDG